MKNLIKNKFWLSIALLQFLVLFSGSLQAETQLIFLDADKSTKPVEENLQWQVLNLDSLIENKNTEETADIEDFILVGFAEGEIGYHKVEWNNTSKSEIWSDGKLVFYGKGRILGKYLLELSYDSTRSEKDALILGQLDPDEYYPILGDSSTIVQQRVKTSNKLYVSINSDDLSFTYGDYKLNFNENRFVNLNGEFSGMHFSHTIPIDNPAIKEVGVEYFYTDASNTFFEDYLVSTGGYLYYLSKKNVRPGSVVGHLEIRNSKTGLLRKKYKLGSNDYKVDYSSGRITLNSTPDSIIYNQHAYSKKIDSFSESVYLWFTYTSYDDSAVALDKNLEGGRTYVQFSDSVKIGATYISDKSKDKASKMYSIDTRIKDENIDVYAEYAVSEFDNTLNLSSDGGLTYNTIHSNKSNTEKHAFYIKGDFNYLDNALQGSFLVSSQTVDLGFLEGASLNGGKVDADIQVSYQQEDYSLGYRLKGHSFSDGVTQSLKNKLSGHDIHLTHKIYANIALEESLKLGAFYNIDQVAMTSVKDFRKATEVFGIDLSFNDHFTSAKVAAKWTTPDSGLSNLPVDREFMVQGSVKSLITENFILTADAEYDADKKTGTYIAGVSYIQDGLSIGLFGKKTDSKDLKYLVSGEYNINPHWSVTAKSSLDASLYGGQLTYRPNRYLELGVNAENEDNDKTTGLNAIVKNKDIEFKAGVKRKNEKSTIFTGDLLYKKDDLLVIKGGIASGENEKNTLVKHGGISLRDDKVAIDAQTSIDKDNKQTSSFAAQYTVDENQKYRAIYSENKDHKKSEHRNSLTLRNDLNFGRGMTLSSDIVYKNYQENKVREEQKYRFSQRKPSNSFYTFEVGNYQDFLNREAAKKGWLASFSSGSHTNGNMSGAIEYGEVIDLKHEIIDRMVLKFDYAYQTKKDLPLQFYRFSQQVNLNYRLDKDKDGKKSKQQSVKIAINQPIDQDNTVHMAMDYSKTNDEETKNILENYQKYTLGFAYRPTESDELNLIAFMRWLKEEKTSKNKLNTKVEAFVVAAEAVFQVNPNIKLSEKVAYRYNKEKTFFDDSFYAESKYYLWGNKLSVNLHDNFGIYFDYALRYQDSVNSTEHQVGVGVEKIWDDHIVLAVGYEHNKFDQTLTDLDKKTSGPYLRLTGLLDEALWDR